MTIFAGIDYSMTSRSITVHKGDVWSHENCKHYYMVKNGKHLTNTDKLIGSVYQTYKSEYERYQQLATWSLKILIDNGVEKCYIEDYAFGAQGRVFQIAENTGLLKYSMWNIGIPFDTFAPTTIKKYATGSGRAKKENMYDSWLEETNMDLRSALGIKSLKDWNPISDIVDSYYIAKLGFEGFNK